jgi:hypothetical protein
MTTMKKIFSILALLLMTAVGATAQTTYTVTVKDGTEDAANWSADPNPAGEGQSVTIKYNGTKKVKSVTAAMAALRPLAEATPADLGKIAGADGIIYGTKAAAEAAGTQAVAMIAYVGSETDNAAYKHGLAIALSDEGSMNWSTAMGKCSDKNTALPVAGASWMLPSRAQWDNMISAAGSYTALRDGFSSVGGTNLQEEYYWSSTEDDSDFAWYYNFNDGKWHNYYHARKDYSNYVRACLVF